MPHEVLRARRARPVAVPKREVVRRACVLLERLHLHRNLLAAAHTCPGQSLTKDSSQGRAWPGIGLGCMRMHGLGAAAINGASAQHGVRN